MKPKIGLITLGVADLQRSLEFYRDGLGFETHNYNPDEGVVFFKLEGSWLSIFSREALAKDASISSQGSGFSGITLAHNEPSELDVDKVFAEALHAGAKEIKRPQKTEWGGYSGYFADPDGHLWEVAYNPFTDLT